MTKFVKAVLVLALGFLTGQLSAWEPALVYRTDSLMASAVAYDTEADSAVELVQLGSYGPSVLRRVSETGKPGTVLWRTEGETLCAGCGLDLEYTPKLGGYLVLVAVGTGTHQAGELYLVRGHGEQRLVARIVSQRGPNYPDEDKLEAGVVGFRQMNSVMLAADGYHILVNGLRNGSREPRTYSLDVAKGAVTGILDGMVLGVGAQGYFVSAGAKGWKEVHSESPSETVSSLTHTPLLPVPEKGVLELVQSGDRRAEVRTSGDLFIYKAEAPAPMSARKPAAANPEKAIEFKGCATDRPTVTGVWPTKRGTFMVAVDCAFNKEENGRAVFGGLAHCLYEVQ